MSEAPVSHRRVVEAVEGLPSSEALPEVLSEELLDDLLDLTAARKGRTSGVPDAPTGAWGCGGCDQAGCLCPCVG